MTVADIKTKIPHRGSMLLIDKAYIRDDERWAEYTFKGTEWFFDGHFPGNPVVPGVVQCEIMAQSCGVFIDDDMKNGTPYYAAIDKVRFKKPLKPKDTIKVKVKSLKSKGMFFFASCTGYVEDEECVSGELIFALVKENHV